MMKNCSYQESPSFLPQWQYIADIKFQLSLKEFINILIYGNGILQQVH